MSLTAMVIGSHPDDLEIGMGGTVLLMRDKGIETVLVDLTNGEPTPRGTVETRMKEAECARQKLGGPRRVTLDMPNRYLFDDVENRKKLAAVIRETKPDMIFCQWRKDYHPDHKAAADLVEGARFYAKLTKSDIPGEPFYPPRIFYYFCSHARVQMDISFIVDITPYFEKKLEVVSCYESQLGHRPLAKAFEHIETMNKYWGGLANARYGEAFYSLEPIAVNGFDNFIIG